MLRDGEVMLAAALGGRRQPRMAAGLPHDVVSELCQRLGESEPGDITAASYREDFFTHEVKADHARV